MYEDLKDIIRGYISTTGYIKEIKARWNNERNKV